MRVIGYVRVSSKGQMDGDGPKRQEFAIENFCTAHKLKLDSIFSDEISGTTEALDRVGFANLMELIERHPGHFNAVVVERMDRLARDLMVSEFLLKELRTRGVKVFATDQGALIDMANNEGDPTRKLIRQIIAALAEWEKSQLVMKLRVARERKRKLTGRCEGPPPYGVTHAERVTLDAIRRFQKNGLSLREIAYFLNAGGFKTRTGLQWTKNNLNQILRNQP